MNYESAWEGRLLAAVPFLMASLFAALLVYTVATLYLPTIRSMP